jgi:hypothetical protein
MVGIFVSIDKDDDEFEDGSGIMRPFNFVVLCLRDSSRPVNMFAEPAATRGEERGETLGKLFTRAS